jgi:hypothetical protein
MRICLLFYYLLASIACYSQPTTQIIDLNRIPQQKIRSLIIDQFSETSYLECSVMQPTFRKGQILSGYKYLESAYYLRLAPEVVWEAYQKTSPAQSWNGSIISFGLLISKPGRNILYCDDPAYSGIDTGQVFYINLRILKGLYNLAVGLEIVDIDSIQQSITYSYLKGGKSRGEQTIYFLPTKKGNTRIIHQTAFKGDSFIRDRYLYPWFHRIAINEFHRNMKRSMNQF